MANLKDLLVNGASRLIGKLNASGDIQAGGTISGSQNVGTSDKAIRNIYTKTTDPASSDGVNGDIWFKYTN